MQLLTQSLKQLNSALLQHTDIPGPELVWCSGQKFGFAVRRSLNVPPALFDTAMLRGQNTVHCPWGAQVASIIEQRGIYLQRRFILETVAVKLAQDRLPFGLAQRQGWSRPTDLRLCCWTKMAVKGGP
jgi:hypothetical protein